MGYRDHLQDVPSQSYFQALDYRTLPAQADPDKGAQGEGFRCRRRE